MKQFAIAMTTACRSTDTVARIGGEEFAILSPDPGQLTSLVERLRALWAQSNPAVTFSAGIAYREPVETSTALQARSDNALYGAKANGRNCTIEATPAFSTADDDGLITTH